VARRGSLPSLEPAFPPVCPVNTSVNHPNGAARSGCAFLRCVSSLCLSLFLCLQFVPVPISLFVSSLCLSLFLYFFSLCPSGNGVFLVFCLMGSDAEGAKTRDLGMH